MTIRFRPATAADAAVVADLFHATNAHYFGDRAPAPAALARLVRERVLSEPGCEVMLAELDGKPVGYASFAVLYPAYPLGGALFMKDLFVLAEARSAGVGEALMHRMAREAVERGCVRFDWSAETENTAALRFYDRLGAERQANKVYYRVQGDALHALGRASDDATAQVG